MCYKRCGTIQMFRRKKKVVSVEEQFEQAFVTFDYDKLVELYEANKGSLQYYFDTKQYGSGWESYGLLTASIHGLYNYYAHIGRRADTTKEKEAQIKIIEFVANNTTNPDNLIKGWLAGNRLVEGWASGKDSCGKKVEGFCQLWETLGLDLAERSYKALTSEGWQKFKSDQICLKENYDGTGFGITRLFNFSSGTMLTMAMNWDHVKNVKGTGVSEMKMSDVEDRYVERAKHALEIFNFYKPE